MQRYEAIGPGDRIHVDLTGPHPVSRQGSVYVLTAIDAFSRFLVAVPLRDKSAVTVATALAQHVFLPFGSCRSMVSDQGTDFCNDVLQELMRVLGIQKLRTTAYRASANGRVERVHRTLNNLLSKEISDAKQKDWQDKLPMVVAAYNSCMHESIQFTPYFLMYGRDYVTPLDLTLDLPSNVPYETYTDYVEKFRDRLRAAYTSVNTFMEAKTQRVKRAYDSKVHEIQLEPGSFAWYFCPRRKQGLYQKWRRLCGICYVEKRFTDVTYSIRTAPRAKPIIAHIDRLRKFEGEVPEVWRTAKLRATPPGTGGQAEATPPDHGDRGVPTPPAGEYRAVTEPPARVWRNPGVPSGKTTGRTDTPPDACNRQPSTALPTGEGTSRTPTGRTSAPTSLPSSAGARDNNNNNNTQPGQPVHYDLRPARARRKPARLRHIQARDFEIATFVGNGKVSNFGRMDSQKDRVGHVNLELRRHPVNRRRVAANV
jgi:transposase InsO family protein